MNAEAIHQRLETEFGEALSCDPLTSSWKILQRKSGHRHSTDDLLTAWYALQQGLLPKAILDLGTGIGTVGLLTLSGLPDEAILTCVEAQDISFRLLLANIALNGLGHRVVPHHQDLRTLELKQRFALITGSPPYFPLGTGIVPSDSQKAHARFELRGDIGDYAATAFRLLADDGIFVFCFPTIQQERAINRCAESDIGVTAVRDVIPREGLSPLFSLFVGRKGTHRCVVESPLTVRRLDGTWTSEMGMVRSTFGF